MGKRSLGIDLDGDEIRLVVAAHEATGPVIVETARRRCAVQDRPRVLGEMLAAYATDPLVATLPGLSGFCRTLHFPFGDRKKIEAALPLELSSALPTDLEGHSLGFSTPRKDNQGYAVMAVAASDHRIAEALAPFELAEVQLHTLSFAPCALAAGLGSIVSEGLFVLPRENETLVCRVRGEALQQYRTLPAVTPGQEPQAASAIAAQIRTLTKAAGVEMPPCYFLGTENSPLHQALRDCSVTLSPLSLPPETVPGEFLLAAALALGGLRRTAHVNLRTGRFAPRSPFAALRRELIAAAALILVALAAVGTAASTRYSSRAHQAEALKEQLTQIYRETFPEARTIVDVPRQMQTALAEARKNTALFGSALEKSPLRVLAELSTALPDEAVEFREIVYEADKIRVEGHAPSFDATNRLARNLEKNDLFAQAKIFDAKMSLDGTRVDFRLEALFQSRETQP